jgi:hypothetical protein
MAVGFKINVDGEGNPQGAVSKVKIRTPFSFAGSAELELGIFKDLKRVLHFG